MYNYSQALQWLLSTSPSFPISLFPSLPPPLLSLLLPSLPPSLSRGMHDMRLWLACRVMLARSLVGRYDGGEGGRLVEYGVQCEEGVEECEACGEVELTAELHYTAALHALTCKPRDPAKISSHTQVGTGNIVPSTTVYTLCHHYIIITLFIDSIYILATLTLVVTAGDS